MRKYRNNIVDGILCIISGGMILVVSVESSILTFKEMLKYHPFISGIIPVSLIIIGLFVLINEYRKGIKK